MNYIIIIIIITSSLTNFACSTRVFLCSRSDLRMSVVTFMDGHCKEEGLVDKAVFVVLEAVDAGERKLFRLLLAQV